MGGREDGRIYSTELCGGTHVARTGDIGFFKIVSEGAVGAGLRRIEALTGGAAVDYVADHEALLARAAAALKIPTPDLPERVSALLDERRRLERDIAELRRSFAAGGREPAEEAKSIGGIKFTGRVIENVAPKDLKPLADTLKQRIGSGVVALASVAEGRASLVVGVTDDLTGRISAIDLVRAGSEALGGKGGGGRPDMAQAGGPEGGRIDAALAAIEAALAARLKAA